MSSKDKIPNGNVSKTEVINGRGTQPTPGKQPSDQSLKQNQKQKQILDKNKEREIASNTNGIYATDNTTSNINTRTLSLFSWYGSSQDKGEGENHTNVLPKPELNGYNNRSNNNNNNNSNNIRNENIKNNNGNSNGKNNKPRVINPTSSKVPISLPVASTSQQPKERSKLPVSIQNSTSWFASYTSFFTLNNTALINLEEIPLLRDNRSNNNNDNYDSNINNNNNDCNNDGLSNLSRKESSISDCSFPNQNQEQSWFSRIFQNPFGLALKQTTDEDDGISEAYKTAKTTIEAFKDELHYAYYSEDRFKTAELAVFGTQSEHTPAHIPSRKWRPVSPNEMFEKSLKRLPSMQSIQLQSIMQEDVVNSQGNESLVHPRVNENYRELTLKTRLRILSKDVVCGIRTENHLYRKSPVQLQQQARRTKRIIVVGVHSFLPTKLVRALIGEYTGTSIDFARHASKAVEKWILRNDLQIDKNSDYTIKTIAIDGQGRFDNYVKRALHLLGNWKLELEESDFIFFVSHGTSVPVSFTVLAKLIQSSHYLKHGGKRKIALLSMLGNMQGPVPSLRYKIVNRAYSQVENEIVQELFEYEKRDSKLSRQLQQSFTYLISQNVKIILTSDPRDLFIPLHSMMGVQFAHPNIHRNMLIMPSNANANTNANTGTQDMDFLISIITSICTVRNLGQFKDYNIVKDLSDKLDHPLFINKTPRVMIFEQEEVYTDALDFALGSTSLYHKRDLIMNFPKRLMKPRALSSSSSIDSSTSILLDSQFNFQNNLPWNIRTLFQDMLQYKHINAIACIQKMIEQYRDWKPVLKQHKDIKYCLEALDDFTVRDLLL